MFTVHIEHTVGSFDEWKRMFDSDPLNRKDSGVTAFRVMRLVDDPASVRVDLELASRPEADAMKAALEQLWAGPASAMLRNPVARVSETVEAETL